MRVAHVLYINYIVTQVRTDATHKPVTVAGFIAHIDAIEFAAERHKASPGVTFEVVPIEWVRVEIKDA